jgi:hypothetical protein
MEELGTVDLRQGLEAGEVSARLVAQHSLRPAAGGGGVMTEVEQVGNLVRAKDPEIVVAGERDRRALLDQRNATIRPWSVADGVPQRPDLVGRVFLERVEYRLEGV